MKYKLRLYIFYFCVQDGTSHKFQKYFWRFGVGDGWGKSPTIIRYVIINRSCSLRGHLNTEHNISREPVKVNAHLIRFDKTSDKYSSPYTLTREMCYAIIDVYLFRNRYGMFAVYRKLIICAFTPKRGRILSFYFRTDEHDLVNLS